MPTTDTILKVQRMARMSRYWARAARAVAAEFESETDELFNRLRAEPKEWTELDQNQYVDLRTLTIDKKTEARNHDREAGELERAVQEMEDDLTVLSSFALAPAGADIDEPGVLTINGLGDGRANRIALTISSYPLLQDAVRNLEAARIAALGEKL